MQYSNKQPVTSPALSFAHEDGPSTHSQNLKLLSPNNLFAQKRYTQIPVVAGLKRKIATARPFAKSNLALREFVRYGGLEMDCRRTSSSV